VSKRSRTARPRQHSYRRRETAADGPVTPATTGPPTAPVPGPRVTAPAQRAAPPVSTKITVTDYGYVVGELRRIAVLTALIVVLLLAVWIVLG